MEDQIRIKINKNKQILDHLAKFTKDIHSSLKNNKGMTLLYYDFNDSKSSLSSRTFQHKEVSSQLDQKGEEDKKGHHPDIKNSYNTLNSNKNTYLVDYRPQMRPPDSQNKTVRNMSKQNGSLGCLSYQTSINQPISHRKEKVYSPCFGAKICSRVEIRASQPKHEDIPLHAPSGQNSEEQMSINFSNLSQFVKYTNQNKKTLPNISNERYEAAGGESVLKNEPEIIPKASVVVQEELNAHNQLAEDDELMFAIQTNEHSHKSLKSIKY